MYKKIQPSVLLINFSLLFLIVTFSFLSVFFWTGQEGRAQEEDAIAIRVMYNNHKYSAARWYRELKKFEGSPQALFVDGYEAIRDGRTAYVNAGNTGSGGQHYSNIYILSYSQNPNMGTTQVFSRMLNRWTFNTNLTNDDNYGNCSISTIVCRSDDDCPKDFECRINDGDHPVPPGFVGNYYDNKCHMDYAEEMDLTCWRDRNCEKGVFCTSDKAVVRRQTIRYANLADLKTRLQEFFEERHYYPDLKTGTYLSGVSLSTWPSWQNTLGRDIGGAVLPVDPINTMGACGDSRFDPETCWDEVAYQYAGSFDVNNVASGPSQSSFYGYAVDKVYSYSPDGIIICDLYSDEACRNY